MSDKPKKKNILIKSAIVFLASVMVVSATMIIMNLYEAHKSSESFETLTELKQTVQTPQTLTDDDLQKSEPATPRDVYNEIYNQNNDFVGWIKIDGTAIDYPVMQTPHEPDYYLRRGFDKKYSYYGVPYAAAYCNIQESSNIIVYGHNMDNGSMFSDLEKYNSYNYFKEHQIINFDTLEDFGKYQVIAVFKTQVYAEDEFKYFKFADGDKQAFDNYVDRCKELSIYNINESAEYGDKLLTLSTCEYSQKRGRFVVVAKKID